jgi:ppGpp synthetase/RelA/SpoT-type nucleotidyltranferase
MAEKESLTAEKHNEQIAAYSAVRPCYVTYADALKRVLDLACQVSFPEALVQARAKTVSSFAEKVARKYEKYPDAVRQMTDLCGARVIVQTAEQVKAVRRFIEANFDIVEKEDKGLLLSEDEFGYRDMHYVVRLPSGRRESLGFTPAEIGAIDDKCAEIQVRTWLEHAWADTLHDRIYKNKLKLSTEVVRTGALLAALMEEGDRNFNLLAEELDGLIANYTAYAPKAEVEKEIGVQELLLTNEPKAGKKPAMALRLARLLAASGDYRRVVDLLSPHVELHDANRCGLLLELGHSLCRLFRDKPAAPEYGKGTQFLEEARRQYETVEVPFVPHLRKRESLHARALSRLGWALAGVRGQEYRARECYRLAHEHEPANPYYLAEMLGFEMYCTHQTDLPASMGATIREALRTCRAHAAAGIELPYAYFIAGRLSLLLKAADEALSYYALGIRHCLAGTYCVPGDALANELHWIRRLDFGTMLPAEHQRVVTLLELGQTISEGGAVAGSGVTLTTPVLIVAGGAASLDANLAKKIRPLLKEAVEHIRGTIISGGTTAGVPGCVGDAAGELATEGKKQFRLIAYMPAKFSAGVTAHAAYDERIHVGDDFQPEQILRNWSDILSAGIRPQDVLLLGFGGGALSAVEYRIALSLGASVGLVAGTKGAAQGLLDDPLWSRFPNLYLLPFDVATVRAFLTPSDHAFEPAVQEEMAKSFHARYVKGSASRLPKNMQPWPKLDKTFQRANLEQAQYSVEILEAAGFAVRKAPGAPTLFAEFTEDDVERMAELEHGRWNVERLRDGWRFGKPRDDSRKLHDCLVPWNELPEEIKRYDRDAVRAFPEILAQAGLEIYRRIGQRAIPALHG